MLVTTVTIHTLVVDSPIGPLTLVSDGSALSEIRFGASPGAPSRATCPVLRSSAAQLASYFAGELRAFDLPYAPAGTPFERRVWMQVAAVPYGATRSYGELAREHSPATSARAVGRANGRNPLPIVVPCHRVVGASGALTGYAGGLEAKRTLLELEGALA